MNKTLRKSILGSVKFADWYEWKSEFLFIPKPDVNGKYIFGKVWKRERYGSVTGEYNPTTQMTPVYQVTDIAYANDKDVFIDKLRNKM